jgi:integrase
MGRRGEKLPQGLYRRRRRDGTPGDVIWCQYRPHGRKQPIKLSTGTSDVEEAKRFLYARLAEDPKARSQRVTAERVTVSEALVLYTRDAEDHGVQAHQGRLAALRYALGDVPLADLTRVRLDALCGTWRTVGVDYPEREEKLHRLRPVSGATCNRLMARLRRARKLAIDKLGVDLPHLTFPHFAERPASRYVSPEELHAILAHVTHPTKRAFIEWLYLLGIRPGQLKQTETNNVRIENGMPVALVYRPPK